MDGKDSFINDDESES